MKNSSPKARMVVLVIAILAFGALVFVPGQRKLKGARAEARLILDTTASEMSRYGSLEQLQNDVLSMRRDAGGFDRRIPGEHKLGDFLRDLGTVLQQSGMHNHILQPRPVHDVGASQLPAACIKEFAGMQVQPVRVQCEGRFGGVFDSLKGLERMERLSRVASLDVTVNPQKPGYVKMEMLIDTFFLAPAPTAPVGGTATP